MQHPGMACRHPRWPHRLFPVSLVLGACAFMACSTPASISLAGTVSSSSEGHMEGVLVTAKLTGDNVSTTVVSDASGAYSFPAGRLRPGSYALSIRATGYEMSVPVNFHLRPHEAVKKDILLRRTEDLPSQLTSAE